LKSGRKLAFTKTHVEKPGGDRPGRSPKIQMAVIELLSKIVMKA